jgi:hypothetical protein
MHKATLPILCCLIIALLVGCAQPSAPLPGNTVPDEQNIPDPVADAPDLNTRTFLLGSSQWPPAADFDAIDRMHEFKREHNDLAVFHQVAGVPWVELAAGKPLPARILDEWESVRDARGKDQKMYVALTPLNAGRTCIADLATQASDHEPLPADWQDAQFDEQRVKDTYLAYCERAIEVFEPDYLAIGIESNILLSNDPAAFEQYLALNAYVYDALKQKHPDLTVFVSIQNEHLIGVIKESEGKQKEQEQAVRDLMKSSDALGLSVYPYGPWQRDPVTEEYFATALRIAKETKRPIAIVETGFPSRSFNAYGITFAGSPQSQREYIDTLLTLAHKERMLFVVNWVTVDYDKLLAVIPDDMQEASRYWAYTGLQYADETGKPALGVWDGWLAMPYER